MRLDILFLLLTVASLLTVTTSFLISAKSKKNVIIPAHNEKDLIEN